MKKSNPTRAKKSCPMSQTVQLELFLAALAFLPWVFLYLQWRRKGFQWWMILAGLVAIYTTYFFGLFLAYFISCMFHPCEML
ncbi:MAG TPA: hypothetical protein VKT83_00095 [bacterium]|nr:hypothetical protein [bacterium]